MKRASNNLQAQFDQYKLDNEAKLAQVTKTNAVALALKDVGAYNSEDLMKFIDLDKIELGEDGKPQLEDTINSLKESSPYLFQVEEKQLLKETHQLQLMTDWMQRPKLYLRALMAYSL